MFYSLVVLLILLIVLMIVCVIIANRKVLKNRKRVVQLIWVAVVTAICYTAFILTPADRYGLACFAGGLYFLATDWLVVYLMLFAAAYTKVSPPSKVPRRIIGLLAVIDSVSFVINAFTHHMFDLKAMTAPGWGIRYWDVRFTPLHYVHRFFVYSLVLYSLCIFFYRFVKSPSIYKSKYGSILLQVTAVVGINILCSAANLYYDYSVALYASLAISICYLALYASPRKLLEKIHSTIIGDSVIGLFAYDNNGNCVGVNRAAEDLFGSEEDIYAAVERFLADWMKEFQENTDNVIGSERTFDNKGNKVYIYATYQKFSDGKGRLLGSCIQFENRTEVVKKIKAQQYKATHDMLTGLLNRNAFEEEASEILAKASVPYCMVCSNIRDFKLVNELYGSEAGDRLLKAQAEMMRASAEEGSVSARIYADKFCTLLPKSSFDEKMFLDNMNRVLSDCLETTFRLHYYIGVYDITDVNEPVWTMYDKAMLAIEAVQGNYDQFVCYYREELLQHIMKEKEVLGEFDRALEEGQFCMFLQPQIANDGRVVGAEALVRWLHPEKGTVSPGVFIPTLEKAGLIQKVDLYMWECAAKKLEEWKRGGREDLFISVNISRKDFFYLDVCEAFRTLQEKYDFDNKKLKLEITESALMENVREVLRTVDGLHELGYDIEIDDFGSGYSSLGMLKDINADILKIDMIFLQETKNVRRSGTILKNIISMSKELGMPVITEGVETREQMEFLTSAGCDMFQGYYFAKPMSVEDFERGYC